MTQPPATDTREIDRQIAERLGWRVVHHKETDTYALVNQENYLFVANALHQLSVYAHNRFVDMIPLGERKTEAEAWNDVPYFTTDIKAAKVLVDFAQPCYFELSYSPDRFNWRAMFTPISRMDEMKFADAREPAEAICRAWLAFTAAE